MEVILTGVAVIGIVVIVAGLMAWVRGGSDPETDSPRLDQWDDVERRLAEGRGGKPPDDQLTPRG